MGNKKPPRTSRQVVHLFGECTADAAVLGGKGAGLARLAALGLPVPPGFTVTTTVARAFRQHARLPRRVCEQLKRGIVQLERQTGKVFGDPENPLLVSVRSGATVSMPGMMDTVLNLGLSELVVLGLAEEDSRFAWDCYRRFLGMFGETALNIPRESFEDVLATARQLAGVSEDSELSAEMLEMVCEDFRAVIEKQTGRPVPDDPFEQLQLALIAVLESWDSPRAKAYREAHDIPGHLGTAVNIQAMVFGNRGHDSGTGVVFSHNPSTGLSGLWGEFLPNAQGEDVVAGVRTPLPIAEMKAWNSDIHAELDRIVRELFVDLNDMVDVEFTVEQGRLYILQVRAAKRTPVAAATFAVHQVWAGKWTKEDAARRASRQQVELLNRPGFEPQALATAVETRLLAKGLPASPGAAVGRIVRTSEAAVSAAANGERVVLVRPDTTPDDLPGMLAAVAIVTRQGGASCHAAVVARSLGKPAVVGCRSLRPVSEDEVISVDGQTGMVLVGEVPVTAIAQTKEVRLFVRWWQQVHGVIWPQPRLALETVDQEVTVHLLINDFYLTDAMARATVGTPIELDGANLRVRVHSQTAERVAAYLLVAASGELRHAGSRLSSADSEALQAMEKLKSRWGFEFSGDRSDAQMRPVAKLRNEEPEEQIEFLRLAAAPFSPYLF